MPTANDVHGARHIAEDFIPDDCGLMESATKELPEGWYFIYQSQRYLETGDDMDRLIGSGGIIVERDSGRVIELGSGVPLERNLQAMRAGLGPDPVDLRLHKIKDERAVVEALYRVRLTYVTPEYEAGEVWKVPKVYKHKLLRRLVHPETVFYCLRLGPSHLDAMDDLRLACDFTLSPSGIGSFETYRCAKCFCEVPNADGLREALTALPESKRSSTLGMIAVLRENLGLSLRDAKALSLHLARSDGACHQCDAPIPANQPVQCLECKALNFRQE